MASPESPGEAETLEHGGDRRAPRPGSRGRRRVLVAVQVVLLLVVGAAVAVDHRVRSHEAVSVARCVDRATSSVTFANRRTDAISGYVRPALDARPPALVRDRLRGLIASTVAPVVPDVRRARDRCARLRPLWFHDSLQTTRRDCLRLLDADLAYLARVTADGGRAYDPRSLPVGTCVPRP